MIIFVVLIALAMLMAYPFLWLIFSSFKTAKDIVTLPVQLMPREWTLESFRRVLAAPDLPRAYFNSLGLSFIIVALVLATSSLGGYVFARLRFPGREMMFLMILSTTMVPFITLLIPLYLVMQRFGLLNSYMAIIIPSAVTSFGIFLCRQFISVIPRDLYEAAKMDGCGDFAIYLRIILPLTKPVLAALAIFTFLGSFNAYLWPLVVLNDKHLFTLPIALTKLLSTYGVTNYDLIMPASLLACLPPVIVFLVFQRNFVQGIALSGIRG
ncbi:MAG: carbohydrate ABC transporter permease [Anaerolineae bacterium]|nr:carbohydrate ABC transporter permease [Candidatus Roseilinea sp.]MDW8450146.1 carbohydrate ABC transporter permease [Anaerolineae bacterium]